MIYRFDEIGSTIDEARDPKYTHGDIIVAEYQTAGRGQRGHKWGSPRGENLMFSAVLDSGFLAADEQFVLLQTVALALADMFGDFGIDTRVKWTNDIYVGDRKITGVLIDHSVREGRLGRSGAGIGINVNQTVFEEWIPNPTSMKLETGRQFDREEVLERFRARLDERYEMLSRGERKRLQEDYHRRIYRLGVPARYALPDGAEFTGIIRGVGPDGSLLLEREGGGIHGYLFREIQFII